MSDPHAPLDPPLAAGTDSLPRLIQTLVEQAAESRAAWLRIERQAIPLLERLVLAVEQVATGELAATRAGTGSGEGIRADERSADRGVAAEVKVAIDEGRWDRAEAIVATLAESPGDEARAEILAIEIKRARDRAVAGLTDRIAAARLANDAAGALEARDGLTQLVGGDELRAVDRDLIGWLMKLIQRRLRMIPIGTDLAELVAQVADRFGGTPEGASLRAALPTLRRSAGLCPRCAGPYLGVDDACPQCLAQAGQAPSPVPTLTFVSAEDDLDAEVGSATPIDLNKFETWQLP